MWIQLKVIEAPAGTGMVGQSIPVDQKGVTLGRSAACSLVLPDPERYVSSQHAHVEFDGQRFLLYDDSTNGTFVNNATQALGGVAPHVLSPGDELRCGEYLLAVIEDHAVQSSAPRRQTAPTPSADAAFGPEAGPGNIDFDALDQWLEPGHSESVSSEPPLPGLGEAPGVPDTPSVSTDPLAALDGGGEAGRDPGRDDFADPFLAQSPAGQGSQDHGEGRTGSQSLQMPGGIPDDWDRSVIERPPPSSPRANEPLPRATEAFSPAVAQPTQIDPDQTISGPAPASDGPAAPGEADTDASGAAAPKPRVSATTADAASASTTGNEAGEDSRALAAALGLEQLPPAQLERLVPLTAAVMRESVEGLMQALRARQTIKNEFRINATMVEPRENNPFKFSISPEDALENLFLKAGRAYLPPVEAVREAFADIADHQLALFSALRTAYDNLMTSFDPERLEARFEKQRGKSLLKGGGRNWDTYKSYYQELGEDRDRSFRHLFAEQFAEAYERIFSQLKANRHKS